MSEKGTAIADTDHHVENEIAMAPASGPAPGPASATAATAAAKAAKAKTGKSHAFLYFTLLCATGTAVYFAVIAPRGVKPVEPPHSKL